MQDFDDFTLAHQLSATASADPNDVLNTKSAFRRLGYYDVPPYGLTPYPDQQLFDGIRNYQRDKRLTVDGIMLPQGETERSISKDLVTTRAVAENDDESGCAQNALAFLPDFPWGRRRDYCPLPRERSEKFDCDRQIEEDERTCRRVSERFGAYRGQRCYASAYVRHGNCIAGRPNFPPLDLGEH